MTFNAFSFAVLAVLAVQFYFILNGRFHEAVRRNRKQSIFVLFLLVLVAGYLGYEWLTEGRSKQAIYLAILMFEVVLVSTVLFGKQRDEGKRPHPG